MANIVPFESGNLPAYLSDARANLNDDLTSHASGGFPIMSIKGKVFSISRDGERKVLPNPKDPESPATSIDVVVIKANKGTSKVFYANGYSEGGEAKKPDCFSNTGDRPDPSVERPQSNNCATCKHNQWGSKIGDNGGKGKACQDSVRIAIAPPNLVNDPMLLRVPPASIRALGELGQTCKKRGVSYSAVVTKIAFDLQSPTPKLLFKPVGILDEATFKQVQEVQQSDIVRNILGGNSVSEYTQAAPVEAPAIEEAPEPVVQAAKPKAEPKPKKPVAVADVDIGGLDLDNLSFDD